MTEKAADAETSGPHCLKVFMVYHNGLLYGTITDLLASASRGQSKEVPTDAPEHSWAASEELAAQSGNGSVPRVRVLLEGKPQDLNPNAAR